MAAVATLLATAAVAPPVVAATVDIAVGGGGASGLTFTPATVTVAVGDSVRFTNAGGFHNVRADDGSFRCSDVCEAPAAGGASAAPSGKPWSVTRTFTAPGAFLFYCEEHGGPGGTGMSGRVLVQPPPGTPCVAGPNTLCLGAGGRFQAAVAWSSGSPATTPAVPAHAVALAAAPQSGLFYFVDPTNVEMLVKVIDACIPLLGNRYWIFFAATTNQQFTLTVTDTQTGKIKAYSNRLNLPAEPVQDTDGFDTCP